MTSNASNASTLEPVPGRRPQRRAGPVIRLVVVPTSGSCGPCSAPTCCRSGWRSLAAVAAFVGVAFLFGGVTQLVVAARVQSWRWLFIIAGILGIAAGILTVVWPAITLYVVSVLVAWYLIVFGIVHLVGALAGPSCATGGPSCCWGSPSWCWGCGPSGPGSSRW